MTTKKVPAPTRPAGVETAVPAAEFQAKCLKLMDAVSQSRIAVLITKRGKPVAKLVPVTEDATSPVGFLRGSLLSSEDLASADAESWADAPNPPDRRS